MSFDLGMWLLLPPTRKLEGEPLGCHAEVSLRSAPNRVSVGDDFLLSSRLVEGHEVMEKILT